MPTPSDFKTAVEAKNPSLIETALIKRVIYVFAEGEDPTEYTALENGVVPLAISLSDTRSIFWLDPDDSTTAHDGVSVIVTSDGYRYHATDFLWPTSLLAVSQNDPPADSPGPAAGDAYHIGAAPTGDWASNAGDIAIYTSRGWIFLTPKIGQLFYNEDDGLHYHQDENGDFVTISLIPSADSVRDTALIGGPRRYIVENQTTDTPPAAATGVYHIVGGSPTGAWSGQTGNIATSYDDSTFTFITPLNGDMAYDRALGQDYIYKTGQGWVPAAQIPVIKVDTATANLTIVGAQSGQGYAFSRTTAPSSTEDRSAVESVTFTHAATETGEGLIVDYRAAINASDVNAASGNDTVDGLVMGLFVDSESSARDWAPISNNSMVHQALVTTLSDTSSHTIKLMFFPRFATGSNVTSQVEVRQRRVVAGRARPIS